MQNFSDKNLHSMKLQPTYSRRGERRSPNFDVKTVSVSMSRVVRNPLILDAIFANLDLPDLKTCRVVCGEWADVGVTLLGKGALLNVNKLFPYKSSKVPPVNDKLMRRLLISGKFDGLISYSKKNNFITRGLTELPKVSELTREIQFVPAQKEFVPVFLQGIRALGSTKVGRIDIVSAWDSGMDDYIIFAKSYKKLPPQVNLTSLRFKIVSDYGFDGADATSEFKPLIKIWTDAAPNLTTLDVAASLYPDLEGCESLKVLKFECITSDLGSRELNFGSLTSMLGQVKDSLIELELNVWDSMQQIQPVKGGPVMSKLTTLSIHAKNAHQPLEIIDFFDEDHLPKLKTFRVHNICHDSSFLPYLNLWRRHRGVKSLALTMDSIGFGADYWRKTVDLFPSVKEFNLNMTPEDIASLPDLSWITEPLQTWELERVNVSVVGVKNSFVMTDVLQAMSVLRGAKSIRFWNTGVLESEFSPDIQNLILHSRGFKSVEISGRVESEIVERIRPIFEASGAPINFTGGVIHKLSRNVSNMGFARDPSLRK